MAMAFRPAWLLQGSQSPWKLIELGVLLEICLKIKFDLEKNLDLGDFPHIFSL